MDIYHDQKVIPLTDFGFDQGGSLILEIEGADFSGFSIALLHKTEYRILARAPTKNSLFCNLSLNYLGIPVFSPKKNEKSPKHVFNISQSDVYIPMVSNCEGNRYLIKALYLNNESYLDTRNQVIPGMLLTVSIFYCLTVLTWIFNGLKFSQFRVSIHTHFIFAGLLKAASCIAYSYVYVYLGTTGDVPKTIYWQWIILSYISLTYVLVLNSFGILGWGSYRRHIPSCEKSILLIEVVCTVLALYGILLTSNLFLFNFYLVIFFVFITYYIHFMMKVYDLTSSLIMYYGISNINAPDVMLHKLVFALAYTKFVLAYEGFAIFMTILINWTIPLDSIRVFFYELLFCGLYLLDYGTFSYQSRYIPLEENDEINLRYFPKHHFDSISVIEEPNESYISALTVETI